MPGSIFRLLTHGLTTLSFVACDLFRFLLLVSRSRRALAAENLFLRKQLALFQERKLKSHRAHDSTRLMMVILGRMFSWRGALVNIKPDTFIRWHRKGFRLLWRWKSRPVGRPQIPKDLRRLIREMATENPTWGEERIANEWKLKLTIRVSPRTVGKYLHRDGPVRTPDPKQRWLTFVRNHAKFVVACDFFVVITAHYTIFNRREVKMAKQLESIEIIPGDNGSLQAKLAIAEIETKAQNLQERLAFVEGFIQQKHAHSHEAGMQAQEHQHEAGLAQQQQAADSMSQASDQAHQMGMAQQVQQRAARSACGASTYDIKASMGEIDVLRSDEYAKLPGCLDGADSIALDQLNTVAHEVMHFVLDLLVEDEAKVVAISGVIQPRTPKHKWAHSSRAVA